MSVNTAHASNGVLIHHGEYILLHSDCISMEFSGQDNPVFKGTKQGRIYLTSHRMIFNNKKPTDSMQSFSAPFIAMSDVELEQPVFGANYIKGKVRAQPNGNFVGEVKFKLYFKSGGAIEYGQALLRAASTAQRNMHNSGQSVDPPPYTPSGQWHEAQPPAYQPPPGYYGWLPTHEAFSGPAPNTVYVRDDPPPYPGISSPPAYTPGHAQTLHPYQPAPPQPGFNDPRQQQHQQQYGDNNMPSWNGFSAPPSSEPPRQGGGWDGQQPPAYGAYGGGAPSAPGYGPPGGYAQPPPPAYGAPPYGGMGGFVQPPPTGAYGGYQPPGGPQGPHGQQPHPSSGGGYPGAMGFSAPPANPKEAEAMASAYNTPYNQNTNNQAPSDLPPSYNDLPPNFDNSRRNQ